MIYLIYFLFFSFLYSNDLEHYIKLAESNNPELKKYQQDYLFFKEIPDEVSALPDPVLKVAQPISSVETKYGAQSTKFSLSQKIPWFGTLKTKKDISLEVAKFKIALFEDAKNLIRFKVKSKWYEIYENIKLTDITKQNIHILNSYESLLITRYENAQASLVDILKIQIEIEKLKTDLNFYEDKLKNLVYDFNLLIGKNKTYKIELPKKILLSNFKELDENHKETLLKKSPNYLASNFRLKASGYEKKLAKLQTYPNLSVGLDYIMIEETNLPPTTNLMGYMSQNDVRQNSGRDAIIPMFNVSIPIHWKKNKAKRKKALHKYYKRQEEKNSLLNNLKSNYNKAYLEYRDATRNVELYKKKIELSNKALEILLAKYTTSNKDFEDILRIQQNILKYKTLYETSYKNQNIAVSNLSYLVGNLDEF